MIVPFRVQFPASAPTGANAPQLFSTAAVTSEGNSILHSMVSGASNTLGNFGLGGLPTGPFNVCRIKGAADTAGVLLFGITNGTNFYEIWRSYLTDTQYFGFDDDFTPKSRTTFPIDYLVVPQSNSYVAAFSWGSTPGGVINAAGFIEIAKTVAQVNGNITT